VTLAVLVSPIWLAATPAWKFTGAWLLFYGLFTLVNAPIDWLALGFTRALLRRGLARRGWWPFFYALLDLAVAALLVAALAFALVLAAQTFDDFAALRAGHDARVLPLAKLFGELEADPTGATNWWA
jgi:hypothetical protein